MVDIVERLKILSEFRTVAPATTREAAEEIERLRSRIDRLRALITAWADIQDEIDDLWTSRSPDDFEYTLPDLEKEEREACDALRKAIGR